MHRELATDLMQRSETGLFRRDRETWLTMAVILLPLYVALVWILWTPMKTLTKNAFYIDSIPICRLWNGIGIRQSGPSLLPAQYRARTASRWVALALAAATAFACAARTGQCIRTRTDKEELGALPILPDRIAYFAVVERIRTFALPGLICFLGLLTASTALIWWLHSEDSAVRWNQTYHMMFDIWGSSAYYVALRFGQCYLIAWMIYSTTLLWTSGLSRGPSPILIAIITAWAAITENPLLMFAGVGMIGLFMILKVSRLFEAGGTPSSSSKWMSVRLLRWLMKTLAA